MKRSLVWVLIMGWLACLPGVFALQTGMTPLEVRSELGNPNGVRKLANGELWVYSSGTSVEFASGRVIRFRKGAADGVIRSGGKIVSPEDGKDAVGVRFSNDPVQPGKPPEEEAKKEPAKEAEPETEKPPQEEKPLDLPVEAAVEAEKSPSPPDSQIDELETEIEVFSQDLDAQVEQVLKGVEGPERDPEIFVEDDPFFRGILTGLFTPILLQAIFLAIAFKWVGAESTHMAIFLIATVDRFVMVSVQWFFADFLEFGMSFSAEHLVSVIVMLGMVTKLTHAKSLPTAIKVVVASKVATMVAAYLLIMAVLFSF